MVAHLHFFQRTMPVQKMQKNYQANVQTKQQKK